jgi:DNA transposition AAA+ family ATPase
MLQITPEFKNKVVAALLEQRTNFDGSDEAFSKQFGINSAVYNQIKNGKALDGLLRDAKWVQIARELNVSLNERKWNMVKTDVYKMIAEDVEFCKTWSKGKICVDDTGIGKTFSAKYLSRTIKNCFYVDASQAKTKQQFVRLIAKTIGVDSTGKYMSVKADLKYYLRMLPMPVIIIDEAGDLEYSAMLELKELWNATEGCCGWYMMGADGLREKISRGIRNKKVGFRELFSRYSEKYTQPVPLDKEEKKQWYRKLITDVLAANIKNKAMLNDIVRKCLVSDENGNISGLRRAESLLIINEQ